MSYVYHCKVNGLSLQAAGLPDLVETHVAPFVTSSRDVVVWWSASRSFARARCCQAGVWSYSFTINRFGSLQIFLSEFRRVSHHWLWRQFKKICSILSKREDGFLVSWDGICGCADLKESYHGSLNSQNTTPGSHRIMKLGSFRDSSLLTFKDKKSRPLRKANIISSVIQPLAYHYTVPNTRIHT